MRIRMRKVSIFGIGAVLIALGYRASLSSNVKTEYVTISSWNNFWPVAFLSPGDWGFGTSPLIIHYQPPDPDNRWSGIEEAKRTRYGIFEVRDYERVTGLM